MASPLKFCRSLSPSSSMCLLPRSCKSEPFIGTKREVCDLLLFVLTLMLMPPTAPAEVDTHAINEWRSILDPAWIASVWSTSNPSPHMDDCDVAAVVVARADADTDARE
uniref:Uncharacterized protein n=1 Tax=Craspedostauros australis TaxID=1486917 RepID=A0A7R9WZA6_9STRA